MQEFCFTQAIKGQACQTREVHGQFTNNIQNVNRFVASPGLFLTYIEMNMDTTGIGTLVISVYKVMVQYYLRVRYN